MPRLLPPSRAGFTLVELSLVVAVLALVVTIAVPRLPDLAGLSFDRKVRSASLLLQTVRQRALVRQRYYRVEVLPGEGTMTSSYLGPAGEWVPDDEGVVLSLDPARVEALVTEGGGRLMGEEGSIHISPRGMVEPSVLRLGDGGGRVVTLRPDLLSGGVEVEEGAQELSEAFP